MSEQPASEQPSPDALASLRAQVLDCKELDDGSVAVTLADRYRTINLAEVDLPGPLVVTHSGPSYGVTVELSGAGAGHHVVYGGPVPLRIVNGRLGTLTAAFGSHQPVTVSGAVERLVASAGTVHLGDVDVGEVVLASGKVEGDTSAVHAWRLDNGMAWAPTEMGCARLRGTVRVALARSVAIDRLEFEDDGRLIVQGRSQHGGTHPLTVTTLRGPGTVELVDGGDLRLAGVEGRATVIGKGHVQVPPARTIGDLHVDGAVGLSAGPGAALERFTGTLHPMTLEHATVTAPRDGSFAFGRLRRRGQNQPPTPAQIRGLTLRGVRLSDDAAGRRAIHDLGEAAVVEPRLDELRVASRAWRRPFGRSKLVVAEGARTIDDASYFAQELAGLLATKCSSGALQTRAAWAAYRGRQLNAGPAERLALGAFRLVGYGQRAGPPAIAWLTIALVATIGLHLLGAEGLQLPGNPGELFLNLLLAPLFLLRLAGDLDATMIGLGDLVLLLIRTVVAVPFVFTLVATGRYLRSEWPWNG